MFAGEEGGHEGAQEDDEGEDGRSVEAARGLPRRDDRGAEEGEAGADGGRRARPHVRAPLRKLRDDGLGTHARHQAPDREPKGARGVNGQYIKLSYLLHARCTPEQGIQLAS